MSDKLKSVLQKSERDQKDINVSTPEECDVYSSPRFRQLCSVRKSGIRSNLQGIAMPLFRTEPEEDG